MWGDWAVSQLTPAQKLEVVLKWRAVLNQELDAGPVPVERVARIMWCMEQEIGGDVLSFEEHISATWSQGRGSGQAMWPTYPADPYRWFHVCVVEGSSEGYWLHVYVERSLEKDPAPACRALMASDAGRNCGDISTVELLILGKSLNMQYGHQEMWEAVGRISILIGA